MSETQTLTRAYPATLAVGDGRTIEGRAVPYGEVAEVVDPNGHRYREGFEAGAFRRAVRAAAARREPVLLYEHRDGMLDIVGPAVALEERSDGLYGAWRAIEGAVGDQALGLIREGILPGLSVGFRPLGPGRRGEDGTLWRTSCQLDEVSLTRAPAFTKALVMAVRSAPPEELREVLEALNRDPELDARLKALGLRD